MTAQRNKLLNSRQSLANAVIELANLRAKYQQDLAKAESERSSAVSSRASSEGEVAATRNKIANVDVRRGLYVVRAPQAGFVVRTLKAGIGETIKEGESIAMLQPEAPVLAAELYVRPMDVPLIQRGRQVRLQFDGWPALQQPRLPEIGVPTLITVGRTDWITPVSCSQTIADLIPDSEMVVFEKSGHSPQIEEAEAWTKTVRTFLHRVYPPTR